MISKEDVKQKLLDWLNAHENAHGMDTYELLAEFIETEKICPEVVSEIFTELGRNYTKLADGRVLIPFKPMPVVLSERFSDEVRAHRAFHTGAIRCPRE